MKEEKKVLPSRSLLQGMPYVNSANTDIRIRFAAMKAKTQPKPQLKPVRANGK